MPLVRMFRNTQEYINNFRDMFERPKIGFWNSLFFNRFLVAVIIVVQTLGQADADIKSVYPACWPATGGTLLTVDGDFPDYGGRTRAFDANDVPCRIVSRNRKRLRCITGDATRTSVAAPAPTAADQELSSPVLVDRIKLLFAANRQVVYRSPSGFEAGQPPVVDADQTLDDIASGNVTVPVRGRHFSCLRNVKIIVDDASDPKPYYGPCSVLDDTLMSCRCAGLQSDPSGRALSYHFQAESGGKTVWFRAPISDVRRSREPDFADFTVDGCCDVTIHGTDLDRGYRAADLSVRLGDATSARCLVRSVRRDSIACRLSASDPSPREITVSVLDDLMAVVMKRNTVEPPRHPHYDAVASFALGACVTVTVAAVAYWVIRCNAKKTYDLMIAERQHQMVSAKCPV